MKRILLLFVLIGISFFSHAQVEISMNELDKHVGDSVKLCTKIYGGIYLDRSKSSPTLLNAGGNYPDAPLTIVLWEDTRKNFEQAPEIFFKDKEVCVTGKIILYKGKPEIIIYDEKQLVLKK